MITLDRPRGSLFEKLVLTLSDDLMRSANAEDEAQRAQWAKNPIGFMETELGIPRNTLIWSLNPGYAKHKWDGTKDPIKVVLEGLTTHRRVGVEAAIATQKTFTLALIVFWFLAAFKNATVVTYAPKKDQLKKHLWKEVSKLMWRFKKIRPQADLTDLRIRMTPDSDVWSAYGFTVGVGADEVSAVRTQGGHDEHMLFIIEEMPGVHPAIVEALLNTAVDEHNLIVGVGNPDHQLDSLHQFCTKTPDILHVRISGLDHPNVVCNKRIVPGAVTRLSIEEKLKRYGGPRAPMYRSRVRGFSPAEASDALIKLAWCYRARDRGLALLKKCFPNDPDATLEDLWQLDVKHVPELEALFGERALGVDVANSKDGDKASIARGRGAICCQVDAFPCPNSNALGRKVAGEIRSFDIDPDHVGVDGVGVGAGTVNELLDGGYRIQNLIGSGGGQEIEYLDEIFHEEKFKDLRSQMYWLAAQDLMHDRIILPDSETLFQDLITPTYATKGGVIKLESKDDLKKRLGRSPDEGDSTVYWNWVRQVRAGTPGGGDLDVGI